MKRLHGQDGKVHCFVQGTNELKSGACLKLAGD